MGRQNGGVSHEGIEPAQIATGMKRLRIGRRQLIKIFGLNNPIHT